MAMSEAARKRMSKAAKERMANMTQEERSALARKSARTRKRNARQGVKPKTRGKRTYKRRTQGGPILSSSEAEGQSLQAHISYIYGKVETIIEYYSNSNGVPVSAIASGVAGLLRRQAGG